MHPPMAADARPIPEARKTCAGYGEAVRENQIRKTCSKARWRLAGHRHAGRSTERAPATGTKPMNDASAASSEMKTVGESSCSAFTQARTPTGGNVRSHGSALFTGGATGATLTGTLNGAAIRSW